METFRTSELKKLNRNIIYRYMIRNRNKVLSKQDIAADLHLSIPTVTSNLNELMDRKLILEAGLLDSFGGRKAKSYTLNEQCKYAVGMYTTPYSVEGVVTDLLGNIVEKYKGELLWENTEDYYSQIRKIVTDMVHSANIDDSDVLGAGFALPATVKTSQKEIYQAPVFDNVTDIHTHFANKLPYPYILINEANAGCLAELWFCNMLQEAKEPVNMAYLSINNFVGGAIVIQNKLYGGTKNTAGEFGHMTLVPGGKRCYCGRQGCPDPYIAAHCLSELTNGSLPEFFKKLEEGDKKIVAHWDEYLNYLTLTIQSINITLDADVVIGGYLGNYIEPYLPQLHAKLRAQYPFDLELPYMVRANHYQEDPTSLGAALYFVNEFVNAV